MSWTVTPEEQDTPAGHTGQTERTRTTDLDVSTLSIAERTQLAEGFWDGVAADTGDLPLTATDGRARAAAVQGRMTARLVVRRAAEADIGVAALWYEQRAPSLAAELLCAFDVTLAEVARMPERFPVVYRESRRAIRPGGRSASQNDRT